MATNQNLDKTNCYRVWRLLLDGGKQILFNFLEEAISPSSLDAFLQANITTIRNLHTKRPVISKSQWDILYPPSGGTDKRKWDITLISCILTNCLSTLSARQDSAIKNIRQLRNELHCHIGEFQMNQSEFSSAWTKVKQALQDGARYLLADPGSFDLQALVDDIENETIASDDKPKQILQIYNKLKSTDIDVLDAVQELARDQKEGFTGIDTSLVSQSEKLTGIDTSLASQIEKRTSIDTSLASQIEKLTSIDTSLASQSEKLTGIDTSLASQSEKLTGIDTSLASQSEKLTGIKDYDEEMVQIQKRQNTVYIENSENVEVHVGDIHIHNYYLDQKDERQPVRNSPTDENLKYPVPEFGSAVPETVTKDGQRQGPFVESSGNPSQPSSRSNEMKKCNQSGNDFSVQASQGSDGYEDGLVTNRSGGVGGPGPKSDTGDGDNKGSEINNDLPAGMTVTPSQETEQQTENCLSQGTNLPLEILRMDDKAIELFRRALSDGEVAMRKIRVMLVGHSDVGKTTLLKRMFGKPVKIGQRDSTDGIEVHVQKCQIDLATGKWTINKEDKGEVNPGKELLATSLPRLLQSTVLGDRLPTQETQQPHVEPSLQPITIEHESVDVKEIGGAWGRHDTDSFNTSTDIDAVQDNSEGQMFEMSLEQSSSPVVDSDKKKQMQEILDQCSKTTPSEEHAPVSFWDFAGQSIFYNTHQVFLAHRTIYLLVTRLDKDLDGRTHPDDCSKVKEFVEFWVNSIHYFCEQENKNGPPVILVATHADTLDSTTRRKCIDTHFDGIREIFHDKVTAEHIQDDMEFAIDNTIEDEEVDKLKKAIFEVAKQQHYWAEQLPVRWIHLEQELFKLKEKKKKIMKLEEVEALNRSLTVPLKGNDELQLFLCFQNDVGNFLYKRDEKLKNRLLLDPNWVSDALKCIITAPEFHKKKMKIGTALKDLDNMGMLRKELFDIVWDEAEFKENSDFLLELMQNLNLIARVDQSDQSADSAFFVPSCITSKSPANMDLRPNNLKHSSILILKVPSNFFPVILFNQLIAVCIKKYPIFKGLNKHYCIYSGCAAFILKEAYTFTLYYIGHVVKIWVSKGGEKELSSKKCQDVLKKVQRDMETILESCRNEAKVKVFACCPEVELNANPEDLIELASDVEEWQRKADQEHMCADHDSQHTYTVKDSLHGWINSAADHSDLSVPTDKELARIANKIGKEKKKISNLVRTFNTGD